MSPSRSEVRGRGLGAWIGALIGAGWLVSALPALRIGPRLLLGAMGLAVVCWLLVRGGQLLAAARRLPAPGVTSPRVPGRRVWAGFWINFVGEIVLLNVAVNLLDAPELRIYWLPAISLVVGLHFWPLAVIFRVPSFWVCGAAVLIVAGFVAATIHAYPAVAASLLAAESTGNALILWATAAASVLASRQMLSAHLSKSA